MSPDAGKVEREEAAIMAARAKRTAEYEKRRAARG